MSHYSIVYSYVNREHTTCIHYSIESSLRETIKVSPMSRNTALRLIVQKKAAANNPEKFILFDFYSELLTIGSRDKRQSLAGKQASRRRSFPAVWLF